MKGQRKFLKYTKIAAIGRAADNPLMPTHGPVEVMVPISQIKEIRHARQGEASSNDPWATVTSIVDFGTTGGKDYVVEPMDELERRIETPYSEGK